ncbi:MAG: gas vesicle protein GvpL [Haloglomus sp.]
MSESRSSGASASTAETGRYLYCIVDIDSAEHDAGAVGTTGIDGEPVSVVTGSDASIGAVVHPRDGPYDSTDLSDLREWLLAHQDVVEAAGERFGTPLPVRFDTVLQGDDDGVAAWLDRNATAIRDAFNWIEGCWEYRVTLFWDSTAFEAEQRTADSELVDIDRRLTESADGKRFLLEKQFDQRLRELVRRRETALGDRLLDRLAEEGARVEERPVRSEMADSLGVETKSDAVGQVAVLAARDQENSLGAVLEEFMEEPGVEVRFTGPWPPYTFAPTITDD